MAAQNRRRSSRPATGGRPGDGNGARPARSERSRWIFIATPFFRVLRPPLESAQRHGARCGDRRIGDLAITCERRIIGVVDRNTNRVDQIFPARRDYDRLASGQRHWTDTVSRQPSDARRRAGAPVMTAPEKPIVSAAETLNKASNDTTAAELAAIKRPPEPEHPL